MTTRRGDLDGALARLEQGAGADPATLRRVASVFETPLGSSRKASDFREEGLGGLNCPDGCVVLDR